MGVEKCQPPRLQVLALVEVPSQEWPEQGYKIPVIVFKTLRQTASLGVKPGGLNEQRVFLRLKLGIKHHPIHDIVQHQLKPPSDNYPFAPHSVVHVQVTHHQVHLLLPHVAVIVDNLVGEEWQCHYSSHFAPVVAVDGENHVLAIPREDIKHNVPWARAKFYALCVEHLGGKLGVRDHDQVFGT